MSEPTEDPKCRCGHHRDDHGSRIEQRAGQKVYVQKCEHCPCETFTLQGGPLDRMIESFQPLQADLARLTEENARLTAEQEGLRKFLCGVPICASTNIAEEPSYGYGVLDSNGFWQYPVHPGLVQLCHELKTRAEQAERALQEAREKSANKVDYWKSEAARLSAQANRAEGRAMRAAVLAEVKAWVEEVHAHSGWSNSADSVAKAHSQGYRDAAQFMRERLDSLAPPADPPQEGP